MKNTTNQFISVVAQQLLPYLLQENADGDELDEFSYDEMKYVLEDNGATVIDLDEMLLEEEQLEQEG